jgi:DNA repair exonuclease SbcCD ATPase subunit
MSTTQTNQPAATNLGALLSASSELDQLKNENELLKIKNEQLKRQIEQLKESNKKPNDRIDTLEEIIEERDDDIDTLKKEVDGPNPIWVVKQTHNRFDTKALERILTMIEPDGGINERLTGIETRLSDIVARLNDIAVHINHIESGIDNVLNRGNPFTPATVDDEPLSIENDVKPVQQHEE